MNSERAAQYVMFSVHLRAALELPMEARSFPSACNSYASVNLDERQMKDYFLTSLQFQRLRFFWFWMSSF